MIPWLYEINTDILGQRPEYKGIVVADDYDTAEKTVAAWYFSIHHKQPDNVVIHTTIEQM